MSQIGGDIEKGGKELCLIQSAFHQEGEGEAQGKAKKNPFQKKTSFGGKEEG